MTMELMNNQVSNAFKTPNDQFTKKTISAEYQVYNKIQEIIIDTYNTKINKSESNCTFFKILGKMV